MDNDCVVNRLGAVAQVGWRTNKATAYSKAARPEKAAATAFLRLAARSALRTGSKTQEPESNPTSGKAGILVRDAANQKPAATKEATAASQLRVVEKFDMLAIG
jgi:hypothetical protein